MSFAQVWEELERVTPPGDSGRIKRRIKPDAKTDLFLALAKPANLRMLLMLVKEASLAGVHELPVSRGVEARIARPGDDGAEAAVELVLSDPRSTDIFTALASDVAGAVAVETDEAQAVAVLVDRLRRWQRFLEEVDSDGLSAEAQRGLYAELWLLHHQLVEAAGAVPSVQGWTGPTKASHDFQLGSTAIEVKSTAGKQHQVLRMQSERQLDTRGVDHLFVFHLSLDVRLDAGQPLPVLIDELREALAPTSVSALFGERLFAAGYADAHRPLYENPGYTIREANFFEVGPEFPRITEEDLRPGVGDVHYSIAVAECKHHVVTAAAVKDALGARHGNS